jgi:hypothetical protein
MNRFVAAALCGLALAVFAGVASAQFEADTLYVSIQSGQIYEIPLVRGDDGAPTGRPDR